MIKNHTEHHESGGDSLNTGDVVDQQKKELKVILIYPPVMGNEGIPYGLHIIARKLKELGIKHEVYAALSVGLESEIQESDGFFKIFGRTAYYEHIPTIIQWNKMLDPDVRQNSFTIIGGQTSIDKYARSYMLESGIDAINVEQAGSFFKFLGKIRASEVIDRETVYQNAKHILATIEEPEVPGGEFPHFDLFPLKAYGVRGVEKGTQNADREKKNELSEIDHIIVPPHEDCSNGCDFCDLMKIGSNEIGESIAKVISVARKPIPKVIFSGPNFEERSLLSSKKIWNAIENVQDYTPESDVVMDSRQFQSRYYDKTLRDIKKFNIESIRLGLNAIDGNSAAIMGRRDRRKLRTDNEIQSEKEGILKFLREENIKYFGIDIILTPFDTPEIIEKILALYKEVLTIGRERSVATRMHLWLLRPYPGTALHERYKEYIDIQNYEQLKTKSSKDLSIRKFDEEPFGLTCEKHYLAGFDFLESVDEEDPYKIGYLNFLALSMAYQYIQGKKKFERIDIGLLEYKDDPVVAAMFEAVKKAAEAE